MAKRKCYTPEAGRQIYRDGKPFISVGREGDTRPVDADTAARKIAKLLNGGRSCTPTRRRKKR